MKNRRRSPLFAGAGTVAVAAAVIGLGIGGCAAYRSTEREVTATIEGKERVCDTSTTSEGGSRVECYYLVFTDDGTFKLTDSLIFGRFRSSDVYGRLRVDARYRFTVAGWRLPVFSQYPNIVSDPERIPS